MNKRVSHQSIKNKLLKDLSVKESYYEQDLEFDLLKSMLKARHKAGLTQEDVANIMGTSVSVVGRLETGGGSKGHSPTIATLDRYAKALGYHLKINFIKDSNQHVSH